MKFKVILALMILLFLVAALIFVVTNKAVFTGEVVANNEYTHTKALCNETNYCQDYEIQCSGDEVIGISPITGAALQKPENWSDTRENTRLC